MKAVLISIKPEWCALIANGQKTIEVRKSRPKIETPFKCYLYCTNGGKLLYKSGYNNKTLFWQLKERETTRGTLEGNGHHIFNGKVIGEFVCDSIIEWKEDEAPPISLSDTCLSYSEIRRYGLYNEILYLWHISDLVIYDKPKELSDFVKANAEQFEKLDGRGVLCEYCADREVNGYDEISNTWFDCGECDCWEAYQEYIKIKYPPQSSLPRLQKI